MLPQDHLMPAPMPDVRPMSYMAQGGDVNQGMVIPEGGLASFLTSNIDEMDDSRLAFGPQQGINSMRDTAERMAQMGRNGDNYVVHASEREMIVPREVVENNPELRAAIMQGIAAEGADPNAYVVGSDANSINPMTGQREFFFKKIVRGVKKLIRGVAPILLPIVGSMVLGPVFGAALGSGAATAIRGGSVKDILKSAAFGGISGGVFAGVSGAVQGVQSGIGAFQGARAAIGSAISPSNVFGNLGSRIAERGIFSAYQGPDFAALAQARGIEPGGAQGTLMDRVMGRVPEAGAEGAAAQGQPSLMQSVLGGGTQPLTGEARLAEAARLAEKYPNLSPGMIEQALPSAQRSVLGQLGGPAALLLAAGAAGGAFKQTDAGFPDVPGFDPLDTSEARLRENPELYSVGVPQPLPPLGSPITPRPVQSFFAQQLGGEAEQPSLMPQFTQPTPLPGQETLMAQGSMPGAQQGFGVDRFGNPIQSVYGMQPLQFAARGGEMQNFPRRMGAISGPGTETSDDVPAMLSDGEFVMTARAVRGAGGGDRREGVKRMYDMMRKFERGGAVA